MKNKFFIRSFLVSFAGATIGIGIFLQIRILQNHLPKTASVQVKQVAMEVSAEGTIHSENEAILHFQTGGKLVYLPFKEGDSVSQGQTIAQLDTYSLQRQLTASLNTYRSTRDTFDQVQENAQNGAMHGNNSLPLNPFNPLLMGGVSVTTGGDTETNIMNDIAKRILDQNQANLDNSVINVELANNALQLATLSSPINGILIHEDITTPFVMVTPQTSFAVANPNTLVFRAQVLAQDIDFVSQGSSTTIHVDGVSVPITGVVEKIYPQKVTTANGQDAYNVDIQSDGLKNVGKLGLNGTVFIESSAKENTVLVPTWSVIGHNFVWVVVNGLPTLQKIVVGKTHGDTTEVLSGISNTDSVIVDPESVATKSYLLL